MVDGELLVQGGKLLRDEETTLARGHRYLGRAPNTSSP
jgi:hypothetical protein